MPGNETNPSPFYSLFEGAVRYDLCFPCDDDFGGPHLMSNGDIDADRNKEQSEEPIMVVLPRRFVHWHMIGQAGFSNSNAFATLLHSYGGGWESVAGGLMTFTVPAERARELHTEAVRADILPKGLAL